MSGFKATLVACEKLEADDRLKGQDPIRKEGELEVFVNDRLFVPNVRSSYESIDLQINIFFSDLLDGKRFVFVERITLRIFLV